MTGIKLKPLLDTKEKYGFRREHDPAMVLGGFLSQFWPNYSPEARENLTRFLYENENDSFNIVTGGKKDPKLLKKTLKSFLINTLWTNPEFYKSYLKKARDKDKAKDRDDTYYSKAIKKVPYHPLNSRLLDMKLSEDRLLGRSLYICLKEAVGKEKLVAIKKKLLTVENHQEAEEEIISTILKWERDKMEVSQSKDSDKPEEAMHYKSLFSQFGEDLGALLKLDIGSISKSRMLLYLERLVNLYALLYYLRIICDYTDAKKKPDKLPPLILPLCFYEADDLFKDYSTKSFEVYRQKAVAYWREYLKERIEHNAKELNCLEKGEKEILKKFIENEPDIFRISGIGSKKRTQKAIKKLEDEMTGTLEQISEIDMPNIDRFTEAFLKYNLKRRTVVRLRRILDWQGPGAGLVAPESGSVKHFHLNPELLETLVIIFSARHETKKTRLSLRDFVSQIVERYGIVLGYYPKVKIALQRQELPEIKDELFRKNSNNFIAMLRGLDMLESLSDTAMYVKCPFPFQKNNRRNG